ncbi:MAG TPA: hypothetical protein VMF61_06255 [Candidatus Acidoferrales bacterium]|nr:hypothetical protein [Candidatus Acidoferrales bacterium]
MKTKKYRYEVTTGLLLGAGASFEIGMPLVGGLTAEFTGFVTPQRLKALNSAWRLQGRGIDDAVLDRVSAIVTAPGKTYEQILADVESSKSRTNRTDPLHGLHSMLEEIVYGILWSRHVRYSQRISSYLRYLDGIAGLAMANRPLWIFSLNHDLIVECIGIACGLPISVGLCDAYSIPMRDRGGSVTGQLPMEFISAERLASHGLCFFADGTLGVNLLKLHGALDLFTFHDGRDVARFLPLQNTIDGLIGSLRAMHEDVFYPAATPTGRFHATNEVAYADATGEMQFMRRTVLAGAMKYDPRRLQVLPASFLDEFRTNIERIERIASIGFSFNPSDIHVTRIISAWLRRDKSRILEIVCPRNPPSLPLDFSGVLDQIVRVDMSATSYLEQYSAKPLSALERAKKVILDARRGTA